jgi:hypothetical protein
MRRLTEYFGQRRLAALARLTCRAPSRSAGEIEPSINVGESQTLTVQLVTDFFRCRVPGRTLQNVFPFLNPAPLGRILGFVKPNIQFRVNYSTQGV